MKFYLISSVIEELDKVYEGFRKQHAEAAEKLRKLTEQEQATKTDRRFSAEGKQARLAEIKQEREAMHERLQDIVTESKAEFARIQADAEKSFPQFKARPSDIDRDMLELFDSGILSPSEMVELSARYEGQNVTMARMLGKRMTDYAEANAAIMDEKEQVQQDLVPSKRAQAMQALYNAGQRLAGAQSPLGTVLEKYQVYYDAGLRPDNDGDSGEYAHNRLYGSAYDETMTLARQFDHDCNLLNIAASSPD